MKIKTAHIRPPVPIRSFDWCAYDDDEDPETGHYGWGKTKDEAIENLKDQLPGRGEPCKKCHCHFGMHSQSSGYRCPNSTGPYEQNNWTP